jgi:hypothetical protein
MADCDAAVGRAAPTRVLQGTGCAGHLCVAASMPRRRVRRFAFCFDEVAEAEAQGLPYVLVPRVLSREEWIEKYEARRVDAGRYMFDLD